MKNNNPKPPATVQVDINIIYGDGGNLRVVLRTF